MTPHRAYPTRRDRPVGPGALRLPAAQHDNDRTRLQPRGRASSAVGQRPPVQAVIDLMPSRYPTLGAAHQRLRFRDEGERRNAGQAAAASTNPR